MKTHGDDSATIRSTREGSNSPLRVFSDNGLLRYITSFQDGIPLALHEFERDNEQKLVEGNHRIEDRGKYWRLALICGDLATAQLVFRLSQRPEHQGNEKLMVERPIVDTAYYGRADVLQWLSTLEGVGDDARGWDSTVLFYALVMRSFDVALWLLSNYAGLDEHRSQTSWIFSTKEHNREGEALERSVEMFMDNFRQAKGLREDRETQYAVSSVENLTALAASAFNQLEVIKYLQRQYRNKVRLSTIVMDLAAAQGHLEVIRYLHDQDRLYEKWQEANGRGGYSRYPKDIATLEENADSPTFSDGCTTQAMDFAAEGGHLDVIKFLHENRKEGCTRQALDRAAMKGHLEVVRFLCEHRKECSTAGLDTAIRAAKENGHTETLNYLYEYQSSKGS